MADRDRRGLLIPLILLAWIFLTPDTRVSSAQRANRPEFEEVLDEERRSLSEVQNSTWDSRFGTYGHTLNLTGLRQDDGFAWDSLPAVKARAKEQLEYSLGEWGVQTLENDETEEPNAVPLYGNVTGHLRGHWTRSSLHNSIPVPQLNLSAYAPVGPFGQLGRARPFDRNITAENGEITIKLDERSPSENFKSDGWDIYQIKGLNAEVQIVDSKSYDEWELQLHGVYLPELGQAILTTTSDKFSGIFMLPHLALSEPTFEASRGLLNESIAETIKRQNDQMSDLRNPWSSRADNGQEAFPVAPACELVMYLQQMAPTESAIYSNAMMTFLERELRYPTGAALPTAPDLHFSMLVFSPDCGFAFESKGPPGNFAQDGNHLLGPKMEVQYHQSRQHLLIFTLCLGSQLFLLIRQMREASTPSTRSRISFYTIAMLALGDGFTTMTFLLISLFIAGLWINLVGTGFLAFISVSFFGMRFLLDIWQVQAPERETRARADLEEERWREAAFQAALQRLRAQRVANQEPDTASANGPPAPLAQETTVAQPAIQQSTPGGIPPPATAPSLVDTGATPVFMPSDQIGLQPIAEPMGLPQTDTNAAVQARMPSFASLYTRFYVLLLSTLFLSLNAASWPSPVRRAFFTILALTYFSFWTPQIIRNVQRNCRHALNWEFVLGQSVLRLVPFAYFYAYKNNVLFADMNYYGLGLLAVWVWLQVVALASQELIGPRWFIRKDWAPPAYDYHPILREDEEGATMPIGFSQATAAADNAPSSSPVSPVLERSNSNFAGRASLAKESKEKGKRIYDCAICMQDLEVPVIESGSSTNDTGGLAGGLLARRTYMVTPCRHIFHSACLEGWMKYRLQCPICRETLPPL